MALLELRFALDARATRSLAEGRTGVTLGQMLLGALFVAGSVGAIGLFIGLSWLLSRALGVHDHAPSLLPEMDIEEEPLPVLVSGVAAVERAQRAERGGFGAPPTAPAPLV